VAPWIWSQLTFSNDALVGLSDVLYLVFKFAVVLWQPFDDNIRTVWHIHANRSRGKQPLTNLEFVLGHDTRHCTGLIRRQRITSD
jgi:hypothetical protein